MKEEKDLLTKIDRRDGMTVPEGYFADFAARMADSLPTIPFEQEGEATVKLVRAPRTLWQRVRPYVYMAAMFAGVWCMLKMFTNLTSTGSDQYLQPSATLAEALSNDTFFDEFVIDDVNQYDLMDEMMDNGVDVQWLNYEPEAEEPTTVHTPADATPQMQQL